jgi:hypothetical protein
MTDKKVEAHLDKPTVEIDGKTGDVTTRQNGVMKGFGRGFRDYVTKGPQQTEVDLTVDVGQWPEGYPRPGKWVVQIRLDPFDKEEDAITMADRMKNVVDLELRRVK